MVYRTARSSASSGAIDFTVTPAAQWELYEIRVHLGAGGAATNLTATLSAGAGSKHDEVLWTQAMSGVVNTTTTFDPPVRFTHYADELDIAYLNGGAATYGVEVVYGLMI